MNEDCSIQVNALLDDTSTKSYINAGVAAELRLQGRNVKVTVNVLNGQVETLETKPISVGLKTGNRQCEHDSKRIHCQYSHI